MKTKHGLVFLYLAALAATTATSGALGEDATKVSITYPFIQALSATDPAVRAHAAWALGTLGYLQPEVFHALKESVNDSDTSVSKSAQESLWTLEQIQNNSRTPIDPT